jgi:hypothetical protein
VQELQGSKQLSGLLPQRRGNNAGKSENVLTIKPSYYYLLGRFFKTNDK